MNHVLVCSFDPVSQAEVDALKQYRRKTGIRDIYVCVSKEGVLDQKNREKLLAAALKPYRHLHVIPFQDNAVEMEEADEEKIRHGMFHLAAKGTRSLLVKNGFYLHEITFSMCNAHRAVHSESVAEVCRELARVHHMDESRAYTMGMLHDITKAFDDDQNRRIIERYQPQWLSVSPKVWHSFTAVVWVRQNMCITDPDILYAMKHHTVGDGHTDWAHLLYIADKIEPTRGYDAAAEKALAKKNLRKAAEVIREQSRQYILEKEGIHV